jgi:hypothetical protein
MCGSLDFSSDGILVFYTSEGKHALYPSCNICDNVTLVHIPYAPDVGEDCCGGGRFRFDCYNVGEPPNLIDPQIYDLTLDTGKLGDNLPDILDQKLKALYILKIITGNVDRAGTDARLDITLIGDLGSNSFSIYTKSEPPRTNPISSFDFYDKMLPNASLIDFLSDILGEEFEIPNINDLNLDSPLYIGSFEIGDTDYIYISSFMYKSLLDLGEINQIQIKNSNSGDGPGWYVKNIEIKNVKTGVTRFCHPNVWISEDEQLDRTFSLEQQ